MFLVAFYFSRSKLGVNSRCEIVNFVDGEVLIEGFFFFFFFFVIEDERIYDIFIKS